MGGGECREDGHIEEGGLDRSLTWLGRVLAAHLELPVQAEVAVYTIVIFRKSGRDEDALLLLMLCPFLLPSKIFGRWPSRRLQGVAKFSFPELIHFNEGEILFAKVFRHQLHQQSN